MMKRIIFTLALMFTLSVNAQIIDTVKIMQIHTADGVTSFEVDNINFIDFNYKINITPEIGPSEPNEPIDTAIINELVKIETRIDKLDYNKEFTQEGVFEAIDALQVKFRQAMGGRYAMRGGKNAEMPAPHAYQRQYSFGPDLYAGYFTVPHYDFMYGKHTSTYDLSADFNGDALGSYTMAKNAFMPLLHSQHIDSIPEIKAINLLFYCIAAQEQADLAGPFTYFEDKQNFDDPRVYDNVRSIYYAIVKDLNNIVACLQYYANRPDWYKEAITYVLGEYHDTNPYFHIMGDTGVSTYIKLANSLKLRMAMHISKVEPGTAKEWAESAVNPENGGVIEKFEDQQGFYPSFIGIAHPLITILNSWGDLVLSASLETLLMSLNHPYTKAGYVFDYNNNEIFNEEEEETLPKDTRICGLRSGTMVGTGQDYSVNQLQAFSKINTTSWGTIMPPLYFIKWAEVDFLRAEGALRGWNMGGSAQFFYERGIRNAYLDDPIAINLGGDNCIYLNEVEEYMKQESATEYWNVDPTGEGEAWKSQTKIGVKWNEAESKELKLEKIITQKYLALFPLSSEAWTELRRTGYPQLFPVLNPDDGDGSLKYGDIIRRIPWVPTDPQIQVIVNQYAIPTLSDNGSALDQQGTRLWWDVEGGNFKGYSF